MTKIVSITSCDHSPLFYFFLLHCGSILRNSKEFKRTNSTEQWKS